MAKRRYALERRGPKNLELRWRRGLRDFQVSLDGASWRLPPDAVRAGATIAVPGGSSLLVQLVKRPFWSVRFRDTLRVERDGVPVPGSDEDPPVIGRGAARLVLLFALLRVMLIALYQLFSTPAGGGRGEGLGVAGLVVGLSAIALLVLGIVALFGRRLPVLLAAIVLALELAWALAGSGTAPGVGTLIQTLVIVHLVQCWQRMRPRVAAQTLAAVFE